MKFIILSGEDIGKSYERLKAFTDEAKKRNWEILYDDLSLTPSLFGKERLIVIRDYRLITKKILSSLENTVGTLVIYHQSDIPKTFREALPKDTKVEEYKLPKLIWTFLENMRPGNPEQSVQIFHKVIERDAPEFIFTLIAKQFRNLYWVKTDPSSLPLESWKVGRLKSQAAKFSVEKLKEIIEKLSEIDILVKTSKAEIVSSLDLLLIKQLE
jgi:DNA polymerase III delta subunit